MINKRIIICFIVVILLCIGCSKDKNKKIEGIDSESLENCIVGEEKIPTDFSVAGIDDSQLVYDFLDNLKELASSEFDAFEVRNIVALIDFPVTAIGEDSAKEYDTIDELTKVQDIIFNDKVLDAIRQQEKVRVNAYGISLGDGEVWINIKEDFNLYITSIHY